MTALDIDLEYDSCVNWATQQNAIPVVRLLRLVNPGPDPVENLEIEVRLDPPVAAPWKTRVARLDPESTYNLDQVALRLDGAALRDLTERTLGRIRIRVERSGALLRQKDFDLEVLAHNQWSGARGLPELLAAFVQPNEPEIASLLVATRDALRDAGQDGGLDGYQSQDPERAWRLVEALYRAVQGLGLSYVNPPASFERTGQKIRGPGDLLSQGMGTCLDLSVLFASALEQMGLHPLIVLIEGHSFPGAWLLDDHFSAGFADDPTQLRKRRNLRELVFFEATAAVSDRKHSFEEAIDAARPRLEDDGAFLHAVDVRGARGRRIHPLPSRGQRAPAMQATPIEPPPPSSAGLPMRATGSKRTSRQRESAPERIDRWKRRLLDLSLRNPLLNHRETKRVIPLQLHDIARFEDGLAAGRTFHLLPNASPHTQAGVGGDGRDPGLYREQHGGDLVRELLASQLTQGNLHTALPKGELDGRLTKLYRAARLHVEETGANTLFAALGFLSWLESESSHVARRAPLLLVPLQLNRPSVAEGFALSAADEDTLFNVALLEKLRADFGIVLDGLDPLPEDESGVDVLQILAEVEAAIVNLRGWEVKREASIGLFSFSRFMMWRDLDAFSDSLLENRVVDHLVRRPEQAFDVRPLPAAERLDARPPDELLCPREADSSQLAAVLAAATGRDFVLEGPPGTGKSQTITNLIAHCVASGKRVLFVSEKRAALDVVQRRLKQIGLGPFCLELHSNKVRRSSVIAQLAETVDLAEARPPADWAEVAREVGEARIQLNRYAEVLHRRRDPGRSVYQAYGALLPLRDALPRIDLPGLTPHATSPEILAELRRGADELAGAAQLVEERGLCERWAGVRISTPDPDLRARARAGIEVLSSAIASTEAARDAVVAELPSLASATWTRARLGSLAQLCRALAKGGTPARELVQTADWELTRDQVRGWADTLEAREQLGRQLKQGYDVEGLVSREDLEQLRGRFHRWAGAFALLAWVMLFFARRALRGLAVGGRLGPNPTVRDDLDQAILLARHRVELARVSPRAQSLLGHAWRKGQADPGTLVATLEASEQIRRLSVDLASSTAEVPALREALAAVACDTTLVAPEAPLGKAARTFSERHDALHSALTRVFELLEVSEEVVEPEAAYLRQLEALAGRWLEGLPTLRDWAYWNRIRHDAGQAGLRPMADAFEAGLLRARQLPRAFERAFWEPWLAHTIRSEPALHSFHGHHHQQRIDHFRAQDGRLVDLTRKTIRAKLASRLPNLRHQAAKGSELGILKREFKKKRRHMPVRKLFDSLPGLIAQLKPCMLMSPLSVAQYLEPRQIFDLVVFDEASQIPPWEAIGAVARGEQTIVVGDSKQLPPTSFFSRVDDEYETAAELEELESILDECVAAGLPRLYLGWHYRSRHHELIAFSNDHYYGNRLLVFPAPIDHRAAGHEASAGPDALGVHFVRVADGVYDKGKSRTNLAEAQRLVADIVRRLRDPQQCVRSIGVVTFSGAQRDCVENLLDEARQRHPELEPFFHDEEVLEPVFVKNLENVQGDERDVILFSIGYGKDRLGKMSMHFGPINLEGGERRLNVAITRARQQVVVFASIEAGDIDLARTRAVGARHLKGFLDFAQRGSRAINEAVTINLDAETESPFEEEVKSALEAHGHVIVPQVGVGGYRIDLAVGHPERPGEYILGVECDGASYHSAKTARDRDRLRQSVLEGLGWRIHRIWSTDWWQDQQGTLERALRAIDDARRAGAVIDLGGANTARPSEIDAGASVSSTEQPAALDRELTPMDRVPMLEGLGGEPYPPPVDPPPPGAHLPDLMTPAGLHALDPLLSSIVRREGPIAIALVAERVKPAFDLGSVTKKVRDRIAEAARRASTITPRGAFLWPADLDPQRWRTFRFSAPSEPAPRKPDQIPAEEAANAIEAVLDANVAMPEDALLTDVRGIFGFGRRGKKVDAAMLAGLERLLAEGRCRRRPDGDLERGS